MPVSKHLGITASELRSRLDYDPQTGAFTWLAHPAMPKAWNTRWAGTPAGVVQPDGRRIIRIGYTKYLSARLAWLYVTGQWPGDEIDHKDCDPSNDRFANLRDATRIQNMRNTRVGARNSSGMKGVCFDRSRGQWLAYISFDGRFHNLGRFSTAEAAGRAYDLAARKHFGDFARVA